MKKLKKIEKTERTIETEDLISKVTKNEVEEPAEEEEPVFVDKMVPHSYPILPEETKHNVRLLSKE